MRFFLSVSDCVFDFVVVGGAGGLERVRPGFAISVWVRMVGLNCSTFGSLLRSLSRLVLSTSWLTSGLPCRGILLVELSGTTSMGVVGIRGLVGSLLNGDSGLLSLLSVGLRSLGVEEEERWSPPKGEPDLNSELRLVRFRRKSGVE